jgi:hypothetical protein
MAGMDWRFPVFLTLLGAVAAGQTRNASPAEEPPQMLLTSEGFIAIDPPKGWERVRGPGLAFFLRKGDEDWESAEVSIYISSADCGAEEGLEGCIQEDVSGFRARFKNAVVREEAPIELAHVHGRMRVWTFQSGERFSAFERIGYTQESGRVLILALSAKRKDLFDEALPVFERFAKSYRGSIWSTPHAKQP